MNIETFFKGALGALAATITASIILTALGFLALKPIQIIIKNENRENFNIDLSHIGLSNIPITRQHSCNKYLSVFDKVINIENIQQVEIIHNGTGEYADSDDTFQKHALKITYQNENILKLDIPTSYNSGERARLLNQFNNC